MITNQNKKLLRNALLLACLASMPEVYAQDLLLANNQLNTSKATHVSSKKVPLTDVLQNLQQQYHISFLYETQNLEGKLVAASGLPADKMEKGLDKLLATVSLRYAKINERTYAILPENKTEGINLPNAFQPLTTASTDNNSNSPSPVRLAGSRPEKLPLYVVAKAPEWQITGKVTGANGEGLPGVTVLLKGSTTGATTSPDGTFSISIPEQAGTLVFSFIGYSTKEVSVSGPGPITVALVEDTKALEEVVVVGYGTQKRESVTGAISSVSAKQISELPVPSVAQALQGRAAGVTVVNTGTPGTAPIVRIRGIGSVSFSSEPLYVVDGIPTGGLTGIDTKDIASVEVLKDAAATAIYGSRAANGVVIITTKSGGKDGKMRVTIDSNVGTQAATKRLDLLNTEQYVQYATMLIKNADPNANLPTRLSPTEFNKPIYEGATQTYAQTNTDWQDELFKSGLITQNNISLSGGNERSQFFTNAGYFKQEGIMQGVGFDRYNLRVNSNHNISKFVTVGQNLMGSYGTQNYDPSGNRTRLVNAIRSQPYMPVYDPTKLGGFRESDALDSSDPTNPIREALLEDYENRDVKILGNLNIELKFTNWLRFKTTGGVDYFNNLNYIYQPIYNAGGAVTRPNATIQNNRSTGRSLIITNQLTFDKTFGSHYINAIAVQERQGFKGITEFIRGSQANNIVQTLNNPSNLSAGQTYGENLLISYLSRINYEYKGKYLLSASFRRDGSSKFAPGNKWGNFPGASIGWRVTEEPFMKSVRALSDLKLRASYGKVGFNGLGDYDWMVLASVNGAAYPFTTTGTPASASFYSGIANRQLRWEITSMRNYGVDFGFLNNKITFSAEYFERTTDDDYGLILSVPTPNSFGFQGAGVRANVGKMQNRGWEFQAGYNETENEFKWNVNANVSRIRNEVVSLTAASPTIDAGGNADFGGDQITRTAAGQPIQSFYGWQVDRIFQNADDVKNSPKQENGTAAGDIKFKDLNGDNVINALDKTFLGNYLPKFSYGLNASANFRNFDATLFFQGVQGNKIYNASRVIIEGGQRLFNAGTQVLDAWTPTNTDTAIPRMVAGDPNRNNRVSDRFLEDGSYLRLKNLVIGYTLPTGTMQSFAGGKISGLRIYFSSQNLFTITKYKGLDPEVGTLNGGLLQNGVDFGQYPTARTFLGGIQITL
ncbi:SusC/RagA family TonB-linked outer membrane protein [Adhaeribacter arboris]|uniref:SusC/RagA family TonB-linked outer membrane protein n=1 Tax=Adhaeribacter arboris TaxID=2072846 RepID=A0A2T2YKZ7_9BACT|nr:TonB-dependent receptor [Adhaeribacter arboris]PSR56178.1 SusC/RagA family TonB-linked outer membrane protein [Adhaeribacter arboris]